MRSFKKQDTDTTGSVLEY